MDAQLPELQPVYGVRVGQAKEDQPRGDKLRNDRRNGHAGDAHVEHDDEDQVEDHVDDPGGQKEIQRPLGVADGAQDGGAEVVDQNGGHPDKVDAHIERGLIDDVVGRAGQL